MTNYRKERLATTNYVVKLLSKQLWVKSTREEGLVRSTFTFNVYDYVSEPCRYKPRSTHDTDISYVKENARFLFQHVEKHMSNLATWRDLEVVQSAIRSKNSCRDGLDNDIEEVLEYIKDPANKCKWMVEQGGAFCELFSEFPIRAR